MVDQNNIAAETAMVQIDSILQRLVDLAMRLMWEASHTKIGTATDGQPIWAFGPQAVTFVNDVDVDFSDEVVVAAVDAAYPNYTGFAAAATEAFRDWQGLAAEYAKDPFADRVMPGEPWSDPATKPMKDRIDAVLNRFHQSAGSLNAILPHTRNARDPNENFAA